MHPLRGSVEPPVARPEAALPGQMSHVLSD